MKRKQIKRIKRKIIRATSLFLAFNIVVDTIFAGAAFALTSGPSSPEFASFEPVATTNMVNTFTGDFTYNLPVLQIPGPDGGGYAMSLAYHSGANSEEEASWVGYGWTLNPGSVNRNVRGFPDDYKSAPVKQYNKMPVNWTTSGTLATGLKYFGNKKVVNFEYTGPKSVVSVENATDVDKVKIQANYLRTLRYNSYTGLAAFYGIGGNAFGGASFNMQTGAQGTTWGFGINPMALYRNLKKEDGSLNMKTKTLHTRKWRFKVSAKRLGNQVLGDLTSSPLSTSFAMYSFSENIPNANVEEYDATNYSLEAGLTGTPGNVPVGMDVTTKGVFSIYTHKESSDETVNGYMHSTSQQDQRNDYYVEKSTPYSKRDVYLGIPFNNADQYMINGEGVGGGFRYYQKKIGHFLPRYAKSRTKKRNLGIDFNVGVTVGVGVTIGLGDQKSEITDWKKRSATTNALGFDQQGVFRFNGDKAGSVEYTSTNTSTGNTNLSTATIGSGKRVNAPGEFATHLNTDKLSNSSYINYHKKSDPKFDNTRVTGLDNNVTAANPEAITEMEVTNKNGVRYIYGVPVFNRNTSNFQIDATSANTQIGNGEFLAYRPIALEQTGGKYNLDLDSSSVHDYPNARVIGEVRQLPYATNYLLTSINTPDYVDVGNDGPDAKDFGGWTRFDYHKKYGAGTGAPWYRWRIPYNGLFYDQNQNSDKKSRTGTISTGEKEVYYLKTVETKTHIAYFVTNVSDASRWNGVAGGVDANSPYIQGSGNVRKDGLGAKHLSSDSDPASIKGTNNQPVKGNERLEYLEKIVLFSKKQLDKPLQVVHFAYDYSLVQNVPNSDQGLFPRQKTSTTSGKLTLKKVWFEFGGISSGKTAPYEFVYKYKVKNEFAKEIRDEYGAIVNEMSDKHGEYAQNPDYTPYYLGPWGNIQFDGKNRKLKKIPWIDQTTRTTVDYQKFDPAAWQLKQIKLPSGGEILVQYEQKDYSFVQNRRPMAMTPLKEANDSHLMLKNYSLNPSYVIDATSLGLDPNSPDFASEIDQQVALMQDYFVTNGEKIYFRFLYNLYGNGVPVLNDCNAEYITGYAAVGNVTKEGSTGIRITLNGVTDDNGRASVPRQACYDFYTTQRHGFDCEGIKPFGKHVYDNRKELANGNILNSATTVNNQISGLIKSTFDESIPKKEKVGKTISEALSYLKIPMIKAKKGGGVRVKRLLMYDAGIENGDANLYGQEFMYEDFLLDVNGSIQKISSGVATNEPSTAREENPLVRYLPRKGQQWYSRLTAGLDRKQFEGPLGESLLPGASVGHSRVIVQSIHKGKTGTGFSVNDYYTAKDYPYDKVYTYVSDKKDFKIGDEKGVDYTSLGEDRKRMSNVTIPLGLFYYSNTQAYLTQGYRFIINQMHGQIKQVASYMGTYTGQALEAVKKFAGQTYEYYEPGEKIRMMQPNGDVTWEVPGKEMDITMERRSVRNRNISADLSVDLSATFIVPPLPIYVSPALRFEYTTQRISTHVTSKVIRYPVILKKVSAFQDGVTSETENAGFNPHTGEVILTRTMDGFHSTDTNPVKVNGQELNGEIYALTVPASWKYPTLGRKYEKGQVKDRFNQLGVSVGSIVTYGKEGNPFQVAGKWRMDKNVLSVGFQTFKKDWATNASAGVKAQYGLTDADIIKALDKIWRPHQSYTYRDNVQSSDPKVNANNRIYKGGVISSVTLPSSSDWEVAPPTFGNKWIASTEVTLYSPHGNALEEKNPLGIYSSARFDNEGILPTMVAGNAQYASTYFSGFEGPGFASKGHSGLSHKALSSTEKGVLVNGDKIMKTNQLETKGGIVKLWVHHDYDQNELKVKLRNAADGNNGETSANEYALKKVAQVGEWVLFSGKIEGAAFSSFAYSEFDLEVSSSFTGTLKIDDVKFQPVDAQTTCYVYDLKSLRLIAQFDDEHFGLYYQYNDEGKLIRRLIETERGMKTVQETQYNQPKRPRK
ncbi:hypothetical protein [Microscilla marina]|uniref:hypothetical protein n=1 Tax=Microscilla marina TaxID=1027 RepID=UPI0005D46F03|nr:hypothetical protein [Microscilla marina]